MRWRVYTLTSIGSYDFFLSLCRQTIYLNHISFIWEQSQRKRPKECMRSFFKPYNLFVNFPMLSFSQAQQAAEKKIDQYSKPADFDTISVDLRAHLHSHINLICIEPLIMR